MVVGLHKLPIGLRLFVLRGDFHGQPCRFTHGTGISNTANQIPGTLLAGSLFLCVLENHPLGGWFRISLMAILSDTRNSFE